MAERVRWAVREEQPKAIHEAVDVQPTYLNLDSVRCKVTTRCGQEFVTHRDCVGENLFGRDLCAECWRRRARIMAAAAVLNWPGFPPPSSPDVTRDAEPPTKPTVGPDSLQAERP